MQDEEVLCLISRGLFTGKGHISQDRRMTKMTRVDEDFISIWHLDIHASKLNDITMDPGYGR